MTEGGFVIYDTLKGVPPWIVPKPGGGVECYYKLDLCPRFWTSYEHIEECEVLCMDDEILDLETARLVEVLRCM